MRDLKNSTDPTACSIKNYLKNKKGNFEGYSQNEVIFSDDYINANVYLYRKACDKFEEMYQNRFPNKSLSDKDYTNEMNVFKNWIFGECQRNEFRGRDWFSAYQNVLLHYDEALYKELFNCTFNDHIKHVEVATRINRETTFPLLSELYNEFKYENLYERMINTENIFLSSIVSRSSLVSSLVSSGKSALSEMAVSLGQSDEGVGALHYNGYGGGFIAASNGGSVNIKNSSNKATVIAGHNSGGFVGLSTNTSIVFDSASNNGSISTTDNWFYTSAGGFVGQFEDSELHFNKCLNSSAVLSHRIAGGFIGMLDGGHVETSNCGSVSGIAAPSNASGFIGYIDEGYANFNNCYSNSDFDVVSTRIIYVPLNFLFFGDVNIVPYEDDHTKDNLAGAFVGNSSQCHFANCYFKSGTNAIGDDNNR